MLGGMGPAATADFMTKLVNLTDAEQDQDHIPVVVCSIPQTPDRSAAILAKDDAPLPFMLEGLRALERAGADVVAIACNSAHHWHDQFSLASDLQVLHIANAVAARLTAERCERAALLATSGAVASGFYQRRLAGVVREVMTPGANGQQKVDALIRAVKAGRAEAGQGYEIVEEALARGADRIILGCTELPIVFAGAPFEGVCVDSTAALAQTCIQACGAARRGDAKPRERDFCAVRR